MPLASKNLLGIRELPKSDIDEILKTTKNFKQILQRPIKKVPSLRDTTVVNLFYENSTRTKLSFELAEKRLSADVINFSSSSSSVKKGESLLDTVNNILSMKVDMVVIRHSSSGTPYFLADNVNASIVNAGDGTNEHPTQALLDAYSMIENLGGLKSKKIAIIGDISHSRVALSNIFLLKKMGAEVLLCGPPTFIPKYVKSLGVEVTHNVQEALQWCDLANVLRIQLERQSQQLFSSLREYSLYYGIDKKMLDGLQKQITIMHPGPVNRGVELNSDVVDGDHSIILDQVENGVALRMAVMYLLSGVKEDLDLN